MENETSSVRPIWEWIKMYNPATRRMEKIGIMVGVPIEGENGESLYNADYSICNDKLDIFNPKLGKKIALGRALKAREKRSKQRVMGGISFFYRNLEGIFGDFCERCRHYFKDRKPAPRIVNFLARS